MITRQAKPVVAGALCWLGTAWACRRSSSLLCLTVKQRKVHSLVSRHQSAEMFCFDLSAESSNKALSNETGSSCGCKNILAGKERTACTTKEHFPARDQACSG